METTQKNIFYYAGLLIGAWLLGLAGESIYAPAMPSIAASLGTSDALIKLTVTFFIVGKTISMFICSPIAEVFARRQFLLFGLSMFILGGLICTFSPNINILLTGRLIQGLGVSITILMGRAIVNDQFENRYAAQVFSYIFTGNAIGIFILPILGGYLATYLSWRWIFFILTCYGAVVFILLWWSLPKKGIPFSSEALRLSVILNNYKTIIKVAPFWGFLLCVAFMMAGEKAYTTAAAFLFIKHIGMTRVEFGYLNAVMWAAHLSGTLLAGWLAFKWGIDRVLAIGIILISVSSLAMLGTGFAGLENILIFIGAMFIYMLSTGLVIVPAAVGIVRPFPKLIGFATAFAMALEFATASVISYLVSNHSATVIPIEKVVGSMGVLTLLSWVFLLRKTYLLRRRSSVF